MAHRHDSTPKLFERPAPAHAVTLPRIECALLWAQLERTGDPQGAEGGDECAAARQQEHHRAHEAPQEPREDPEGDVEEHEAEQESAPLRCGVLGLTNPVLVLCTGLGRHIGDGGSTIRHTVHREPRRDARALAGMLAAMQEGPDDGGEEEAAPRLPRPDVEGPHDLRGVADGWVGEKHGPKVPHEGQGRERVSHGCVWDARGAEANAGLSSDCLQLVVLRRGLTELQVSDESLSSFLESFLLQSSIISNT